MKNTFDYRCFKKLFFNVLLCLPGVYLDGCCVQHQKPMLEGGTLGSKGHTLVVVPHLTESYGQDTSTPSNAIPLCTLKNFPHRIEHTLQVHSCIYNLSYRDRLIQFYFKPTLSNQKHKQDLCFYLNAKLVTLIFNARLTCWCLEGLPSHCSNQRLAEGLSVRDLCWPPNLFHACA